MMNRDGVYLYQQKKAGYEYIDDWTRLMIREAVSLVKPGDHVVIKPNFVRQSSLTSKEWIPVITNPVLIREVIHMVAEHLKDTGIITILDGPQEDSDFKKIVSNTGLETIIREEQKYTKVKIEWMDIRVERKVTCNGIVVKRIRQRGDLRGYKKVDLGKDSCFAGKVNKDYYGADYDRQAAKSFHNEKENSYVISGTVLDCDVFINMPKWKTHKIGGMTCCLKNAVGIIGVKNCIPHHTLGSPGTKGDAYPQMNKKSRAENRLKKAAHAILNRNIPFLGYGVALGKWVAGLFLGKPMEVIRSGHWYGNDTLWRAILDLNRILLYADKDGILRKNQQRNYICIIDGIIAGEKNGPMMPEPKECGVVGFCYNPLLGDVVMSYMMGFDYRKIPSIANGFELSQYKLSNGVKPEDIQVFSNNDQWNKKIDHIDRKTYFRFCPAFGWEGHIELN